MHCLSCIFLSPSYTVFQHKHTHTHTHTHIHTLQKLIMADYVVNIMHKKQDQNGMQSVQFPWVLNLTFLGKFPIWLHCSSISCLVTLLMTDVVTPIQTVQFSFRSFLTLKMGAIVSDISCVFITLGDDILTFYSLLIKGCTNELNILIIVRSAHTVSMCFVFVWEQTATCAAYSINWLVFITKMKSVYSAVQTGSLNEEVCACATKA
jgi:hypothetical protein